MNRFPWPILASGALAASLLATAASCKKSTPHEQLPVDLARLARSDSTAALPEAATLAFVEPPSIQVRGVVFDDCQEIKTAPCSTTFELVPASSPAITLPPPPLSDALFLASPEGKEAMGKRRTALAKMIDAFKPIAATEESLRVNANRPAGATLLAVIPANAPSWVAYEALYTGTRAGFRQIHFLVKNPIGTAVLSPVFPPKPVGPVHLALVVTVEPAGFVLRGPLGTIAPGCEGLGPGITVPAKTDGTLDFPAVSVCASKTRTASPGLAPGVDLIVSSKVDFQTLANAFDALRRNPDGSAMFTEIRLHMPKSGAEAIPPSGSTTPSASSMSSLPPAASSSAK